MMSSPLDAEKITWISQSRYGPGSASWQVWLDGSLGSSWLSLDQGKEADIIWQSFLALSDVYCFEQGMTTYAYNFAKVKQALIAGQWGRFVFVGDRRFPESSLSLEPLRDGAFSQALIAYRTWLQTQCPEGQEPHALLTIVVPPEIPEHSSVQLGDCFPGIQLGTGIQQASIYQWPFPLDCWLSDVQQMALGLFEHVISVPGDASQGEPTEGLPVNLRILPFPTSSTYLSSLYSDPSETIGTQATRGRRIRNGGLILAMLLLFLLAFRWWRQREG